MHEPSAALPSGSHSIPIVPASEPHAQKTLSLAGRSDAASSTKPPWASRSVESVRAPQKKLGSCRLTTDALSRSSSGGTTRFRGTPSTRSTAHRRAHRRCAGGGQFRVSRRTLAHCRSARSCRRAARRRSSWGAARAAAADSGRAAAAGSVDPVAQPWRRRRSAATRAALASSAAGDEGDKPTSARIRRAAQQATAATLPTRRQRGKGRAFCEGSSASAVQSGSR